MVNGLVLNAENIVRVDGAAAQVGIAVHRVKLLEKELTRAFAELQDAAVKAAALDLHVTPRFGVTVEAALKAWKAEQRDGRHREVGRIVSVDEEFEAPLGLASAA